MIFQRVRRNGLEINAEKCADLPLIEEPMDPLSEGAEGPKTELGF